MIWIGIMTGFYGFLFPGNINLLMVQLYSTKRYMYLALAGLLVVIFETLYCYFTIRLLGNLKGNTTLFYYIEISVAVLALGMALWLLFERKSAARTATKNIYRGFFSIVVNPQQIPYWFLAGTIFQDIIFNVNDQYSVHKFVVFNNIGVLLILTVYAILGEKLISVFKLKLHQINRIVGVSYLFAFLLTLKHLGWLAFLGL